MENTHTIKSICGLTSMTIKDGVLIMSVDNRRTAVEILSKQVIAIENELEKSLSVDDRCRLVSTLTGLVHQMQTYS